MVNHTVTELDISDAQGLFIGKCSRLVADSVYRNLIL